MYMLCLINFKIQYHIACLTSSPLATTLDVFFLLQDTPGPVRMFQTLNYKFQVVTINFYAHLF